MKRRLDICEKCEYYIVHQTQRPDSKTKTLVPYKKYFCHIDNRGLERTGTGVRWKEDPSEVSRQGYVDQGPPTNCILLLEHSVLSDENQGLLQDARD